MRWSRKTVNRADLRKAHRWPRCIVPAQRLEARAGEPRQVHPYFRPAGAQGDDTYWGRSKKSIHITDQPWQVAKAVCCWVGIGKPPICSPCTGSWHRLAAAGKSRKHTSSFTRVRQRQAKLEEREPTQARFYADMNQRSPSTGRQAGKLLTPHTLCLALLLLPYWYKAKLSCHRQESACILNPALRQRQWGSDRITKKALPLGLR